MSQPYLLIVFYENLHHNVLKFDVHHGSYSLFLGAHQCRAKDHTKIRYRHQILLAVCGYPAKDTKSLDLIILPHRKCPLLCSQCSLLLY